MFLHNYLHSQPIGTNMQCSGVSKNEISVFFFVVAQSINQSINDDDDDNNFPNVSVLYAKQPPSF